MLAAGLLVLCPCAASYAEEDAVVADSEAFDESDDTVTAEETASADLISTDGLFEVVNEKVSHSGESLEDVMPQPEIAPIPAEPPSSSLHVETLDPYPSPARAREEFAKEYKKADHKFSSDSLFYTCTKIEEDDSFYYLTHIVIKDPSQINGDHSYGSIAGERESVLSAADRNGAKIAINGSYFRYETGYAYGGELLIRNNQVLHGAYADGYEICLRQDGTLFSPGYNTIDSVLAQNVVFSWGTCEDLLIQDSKKCVLTDYDWNGFRYPRTAIGMVRPLEYYIITAGGAGYTGGITIYREQEIFYDLGCAYARGLDGGGSSCLVIDGKYINENGDRSSDGTLERRNVADFLLIYEDASAASATALAADSPAAEDSTGETADQETEGVSEDITDNVHENSIQDSTESDTEPADKSAEDSSEDIVEQDS